MKKSLSLLLLAVIAILPMSARERVTTNASELPAAANAFLQKHFPKTKVNHIKIESGTFGGTDYDVILSNGSEIEFDSKGNIKEIDCGYNSVPEGLILKPITDYVRRNFKGQKIVSVDISRNKYEVELSNGVELEFDRDGSFRKADY
ncbi:MAG: PepSY-like domain-containing protein [Paramuribaculum sp.]|nr:PepSY-like domain-containing protein [Paramuribaculum sp.]MDE6324155.1 PepSY-like domain-containing protein [Paramuribaculum sp.]